MHHINKKKIHYRTLIKLVELLGKVNYDQDKLIYKRIEKSIYEVLAKFPTFHLMLEDLKIIKENMAKKRLTSKAFEDMIIKTLKNPEKSAEIKEEYLKHEHQFWKDYDLKLKTLSNHKNKTVWYLLPNF